MQMPTKLTSTALQFSLSGSQGSIGFANNKITSTKTKFLNGLKTSFLNIGDELSTPDFGELAAESLQIMSGAYAFEINTQPSIPQAPVRSSNIGNRNLANAFTGSDSITLASGDRFLLAGQTNPVENGVYVVLPNLFKERASDFAIGESVSGYTVFIQEGVARANKTYICANMPGEDVVGTHELKFVEYLPYALSVPKPENNSFLSYDRNSSAWVWSSPPSVPLGYEKIWNFATFVFSWSSAYPTRSSLTLSSTHASFVPTFQLNSDKGTRLRLQSTAVTANQSVASWSQPNSNYWEIRAAVSFGPAEPVSEGFIFFGNDTLTTLTSSDAILGAGHLTGYGVELDFNGYNSGRIQVVIHEGETKTAYWCGINLVSLFRIFKVTRNGQLLRFEISEQGTISGTGRVVIEHLLTENYSGNRFGFTSYTSGTSSARHNAELTYFESRTIADSSDDF
jgi:hypothetical protein